MRRTEVHIWLDEDVPVTVQRFGPQVARWGDRDPLVVIDLFDGADSSVSLRVHNAAGARRLAAALLDAAVWLEGDGNGGA